jgi:FkbM family methyltransferase
MSIASKIRHSFIGRSLRKVIHISYHLQNHGGRPVNYRLPGGTEIKLLPEGEIAEFLSVQRFFEKTELGLVANYLKPGMTVIDVGANIGVYSILAAKLVGDTGNVWAFEPSLASFQRLTKNLRLNGCDHVRSVRMALSAHPQTFLKLKSDAGFGDAYRYLSHSAADDGDQDSEWVPATTLDLFNQENGIADAAFLKIDVEGGEYGVFQGAEHFLRSNSDISIMFESESDWCRRAGCTQQDSFKLLERLGFGLYAWHNRARRWTSSEDALLRAGMVWASRDVSRLPMI